MLTAASCLSEENDVRIFWNPQEEQEIKVKAREKLGINLKNVKFTENIFSKNTLTPTRVLKSREFDRIIFLSDGSIPLVGTKLIVHFQFPVEWVKTGLKTKFKISGAGLFICNSNFTKSFIDKKFGMNSIVLYPPVYIKKTQSKKENIILHVGRFGNNIEGRNYKKQDVMIDAFKKLKAPGWRFVLIVGFRNDQKEFVELLKEKARGYPIEIVENPDNKTLWSYYSKAKIYWHASGYGEDLLAHPEYAEHFGISTVEAMGAGAVPVVINAGGQKEIVEQGKSGFLWDTLGELVQKTKLLTENQNLWAKLSKAAEERAKYFAGDRFCNELLDLIKD